MESADPQQNARGAIYFSGQKKVTFKYNSPTSGSKQNLNLNHQKCIHKIPKLEIKTLNLV
jgi:hypothetical protein